MTFLQTGRRAAVALLCALALIAGCSGGGGGRENRGPDPQQPAPNPRAAQSWSVTLDDNPTDNCFKPGATIGLVVSATNSTGAPISNPAYTVSASPADGLETDTQGVTTVVGEGALELTVTYTGDLTPNSTVTPQTFQLIRDGTAPVITITSPARGAIRQTAVNDEAVTVAGNVTDALSALKVILVDDDSLAVSGANLSESIAVSRPARWGTNVLHVRAADACGNTARHAQGFLQSDTFLPPATSKSLAARVPGANTMRIAQVVFDDTNRNDFDDLATVSSRFLQTNMTTAMNAVLAQLSTLSFDVLSCTFSADPMVGATIAANSPTLSVALLNGGFALTYVMQWTVFALELLSPVMLWLRGRALLVAVGFWIIFHACTYVLLTIHFLPTAVCLLAFLPLERIGRRHTAGGRGRTDGPESGEPPTEEQRSRRRVGARLRTQS